MSPLQLSAAAVILLTCILSTASAFNITRILNRYPEYGVFNDLLTRTGLATHINAHSTITVLAVKNGGIGDLSSRPIDLVDEILRTHVILDYFDIMKLHRLKNHQAKLTTMYQQTGIADRNQGFLNVTSGKDGIVFGSAVRRSPHDAHLEEEVMSRPYNISVLGVSTIIVTPGLDDDDGRTALAPVEAPPPDSESPAPAPARRRRRRRKRAPAPAEAETPASDADDSDYSPTESPANGPGADGPEADSISSAGKSAAVSLGGFFVLLCSLLAAH
ncbi:PREDICTED: fasciclin-like arabinogalactan protein 3 [Ipomoea nil]|uniref:fasciclin-like arabinogalactan protein 3 n=1 Tax=Ipomoea nil TaxID=35883 RepID=UPI0009014468|nr:PREDICTED: fasciclin-like arabinogalactan protein 3 [Ipomoea nil]